MRSQSPQTVIIGLNWVGDNILALPTYRALQNRYRGEGGIALAVPPNVAGLMVSSGLFRSVIPWTSRTRQRIAALRRGHYRRAIILPNSFRSVMVTLAARIGERWGYATDYRGWMLTHRVPRQTAMGHQLEDYAPLLAALSAPRVVDEIPALTLPVPLLEGARAQLRALGVRGDRPLVGLHAGGLYGRAKHWGDARYRAVATRLRAEGFDVVLLTSPGERHQAESIAASCNGLPVFGAEGDVLHLAAAISHCSLIITNDSGPLHLATALAVPSIAIFGPTDPARTVIPGVTRVIRRPLACQPCYQRDCPLQHHRCMTEIEVDDVHTAAVGLFQEIEEGIPSDDRRTQLP